MWQSFVGGVYFIYNLIILAQHKMNHYKPDYTGDATCMDAP